jgi:dCMP deaminase
MKRKDYISWDEYFMGLAVLSAKRSKDPGTQVGACIVNTRNKVVGMGYNGLPIGCSDDQFPWVKEGDFLETKYPYVCHAELNAILNNVGIDLNGCKLYSTLFPCNECAKAIIQSGIKEVVYLSDKYSENSDVKVSKILFDAAGIKYRIVEVNRKNICLDLTDENNERNCNC